MTSASAKAGGGTAFSKMMDRRHLLALMLSAGAAGCGPERQDGLTVFAAVSLKDALDEIAAAYQASGGDEVRISYGASSTLARQIEQGAPADVFIPADLDWMEYLAARGLVQPGTRRTLTGNALVLIAPANSKLDVQIAPGAPLGAILGGGRFAVAAREVPAGRYAETALRSLDLWDQVRGRLARADNVRAALQYVARGEAPLGVVYRTDAAAEPRVKILDTFPPESHPPISYPAALTVDADRAGDRLLDFLQGPRAAAILREKGFLPPPP